MTGASSACPSLRATCSPTACPIAVSVAAWTSGQDSSSRSTVSFIGFHLSGRALSPLFGCRRRVFHTRRASFLSARRASVDVDAQVGPPRDALRTPPVGTRVQDLTRVDETNLEVCLTMKREMNRVKQVEVKGALREGSPIS